MDQFTSVPQSLLSSSDDWGRYPVPRGPQSSDPVGTGELSEEEISSSVVPHFFSEHSHD